MHFFDISKLFSRCTVVFEIILFQRKTFFWRLEKLNIYFIFREYTSTFEMKEFLRNVFIIAVLCSLIPGDAFRPFNFLKRRWWLPSIWTSLISYKSTNVSSTWSAQNDKRSDRRRVLYWTRSLCKTFLPQILKTLRWRSLVLHKI